MVYECNGQSTNNISWFDLIMLDNLDKIDRIKQFIGWKD